MIIAYTSYTWWHFLISFSFWSKIGILSFINALILIPILTGKNLLCEEANQYMVHWAGDIGEMFLLNATRWYGPVPCQFQQVPHQVSTTITANLQMTSPSVAHQTGHIVQSFKCKCFWVPQQCDQSDNVSSSVHLTHWGRDKMAAIFQTTLSNGFSWMKMFKFRLRFHWSLLPRVQLTIFQCWFR